MFYNKASESCSDIEEIDFDYTENDSDTENDNKKMINLVIKTDKINFNSSSSSTSSSHSSTATNNVTEYYQSDKLSMEQQAGLQTPSISLWIGNVDPSVNEEILIEMFSSYGPLSNVRCLPEKYCAFVNFKIKEDAQKAMQNLQVR